MARAISRLVGTLFLLLVGCETTRLEGRWVVKPDVAYELGDVPAGWRRIQLADNDLAFLSETSGHSMAFNATCKGYSDSPLGVLTNHLLIGFTERDESSNEKIPLDGREALRTRHTAKMDGVPLEMLFVVLKKDGCVYDMTYLSPQGRFDERVKDFDAVVQGFHAKERRR